MMKKVLSILILFTCCKSPVTDNDIIPEAPRSVSLVRATGTTIKITWAESDRAIGYRVYRDLNQIAEVQDLFFEDTGLNFNTSYRYSIRAFNSAGQSDPVSVTVKSLTVAETCKDTNCANYTSQSVAQAAYNADKLCRGDLDADKDGIACEEPGNSVKNCTSTSNCGCSKYNKSSCGGDICCQWIVGSGCRCK